MRRFTVGLLLGLFFAAAAAIGQGIRSQQGTALVMYDQNGNTFSFPTSTSTLLFSTLSTNALDVANSFWAESNAIAFEGTTANAFEIRVTGDDATADRSIMLPNADGTFFLSTLSTNAPDAASSLWGSSANLNFEGSTADANETSLTATDPTADLTFVLPNQAAGTYPLLFSTLSTNALDAANSIWAESNNLAFEGTTADAFELRQTPTDPTADRTVTWPDANVNFASPAPSDGFVLTYDSGTSTWQPEAGGGSAANPGYFMFPTSMPGGEEGNTVISSANQVRVIRYYLPFSATVDRIVFNVETAVGGATCGVGIYNAAGTTLLVDGSGQSCATTGVKNVDVNVSLTAGFYLVAYTSSSATVAILTQDAVIDTWYDVFNATVVQSGTAANAATAGVLPATTGTLTAVSANSPVVKIQF